VFLSESQFQNELDYGVTMLLIGEMLTAELINKAEFAKLEKLYTERFHPLFKSAQKPEQPCFLADLELSWDCGNLP